MKPKITKVARDELACAVRQRYLGATSGEKGQILGEFIANSGSLLLSSEVAVSWPDVFDSLQKFVVTSMAVEANEAN